MVILLFVSFYFSFFFSGWSGFDFYFNSWFNFHLSYLCLLLYYFILYDEHSVDLIWLSRLVVFFSFFFFFSYGMLFFYIFFELVFFPMLLMIYRYGSQPEKIGSIYYAVFYTSVFSFPFLWGIMKMGPFFSSLYLSSFSLFMFVGMFLGKIPIFGLHVWLPKAHVEAPTSGSMVLAGVLLKVGVYGYIKMLVLLNFFNYFIMFFSFLGVMLAVFICSFSVESKIMVAYSSVSHMNLGLYCLNVVSGLVLSGNYILCMSHGYISSLLFFMMGKLYDYNGTRILFYLGSMLNFISIGFMFSLIILGNMAVPPIMSFWGELMLLLGVFLGYLFNIFFFVVFFLLGFYYSVFIMMHLLKPNVSLSLSYYFFVLFVLGFISLLSFISYSF